MHAPHQLPQASKQAADPRHGLASRVPPSFALIICPAIPLTVRAAAAELPRDEPIGERVSSSPASGSDFKASVGNWAWDAFLLRPRTTKPINLTSLFKLEHPEVLCPISCLPAPSFPVSLTKLDFANPRSTKPNRRVDASRPHQDKLPHYIIHPSFHRICRLILVAPAKTTSSTPTPVIASPS